MPVGHAAALYHDGRAATLEDIFTRHPHAKSDGVPPGERDDLVRFLRGL